MTFHGESLYVEPVFRTTGDYVDGLRYRAGSASFASGESFRAWVQTANTWYLWADPSTPVVVSWVVEVAGGSGTLTLSEGTDPDGGFGAPPATGTALGAHAVTGPETLVVGSTLFDGAYVLGGADSMVLRVDVTGGTVEIQQVKLRVWPVAGAVGGFSPTLSPSWAGGTSFVGIVASGAYYTGTSEPETDGMVAWAAAWADLNADPAAVAPFTYIAASGTGGGADGVINTVDLTHVIAVVSVTTGSLIASPAGPSWPIESGVDYLVPPNEVRADPDGVVQQVGAPTLELFDWSLAVSASSDLPLDECRVHSEILTAPDDISDVGPVESGGTAVPTPAAHTTTLDSWTIPEPDIGDVLHVSVNHTGRGGTAPTYPAGTGSPETGAGVMVGTYAGEEFTPATSRVIYPPYRVWTLEAYRPLRQWPLDEGNGGTPRRYGGRSTSRLTSKNARGFQ